MFSKISYPATIFLSIFFLSSLDFVQAGFEDELVTSFSFNDALFTSDEGLYSSEVFGVPEGAVDRDGNINSALYFSGSSNLVTDLSYKDEFSAGDPITISVWFKSSQTSFRSAIVSGTRPGGGPDIQALLENGRVVVRLYGGPASFSDSQLNDGQWHHIVWGTDGQDNFFYIDGLKQSDQLEIGSDNRDVLTFGSVRDSSNRLVGTVDDYKLYSRALSEEEIMRLYVGENQNLSLHTLNQLRIDGETNLPEGSSFVGNGVVFSGVVGVGEDGLERGLEVEVKLMGEAFDGADTHTSELGTDATTLVRVTDFLQGGALSQGENSGDFKWRARTVDEEGNMSDWVEFGDDAADFSIVAVPLMTQVVSPYPNEVDTASWAGELYADGLGEFESGFCDTIEECGCAISSLTTLARHHGIEVGIDGSAVNPKNLNDWLLENNGYNN